MAALRFSPPSAFDFTHPGQWTAWKLRFNRFRIASKLDESSDEVQVATLVYTMGMDADQVFEHQLGLSDDQKKDFDEVLKAFDTYFTPSVNIVHERSKFEQIIQQPGQSLDEFVRALYKGAEHCAFQAETDNRIRDRLIAHMRDKRVSRELQMKAPSEQTLAKSLEFARQAERVAQQVAEQSSDSRGASSVGPGGLAAAGVHQKKRPDSRQWHREQETHAAPSSSCCPNCGGRTHPRDRCPARGKSCRSCGKKNHFAKVCRATRQSSAVGMNSVGFAPDESDDPEQFFVGTTAADNSDTSPWFAELQVGTTMVRFKLDTGADVSTMSKTVWLSISPQPTLQSTKVQLRGADDQLLPVCGVFSASLKYKGKATDVRMYVLERASGCLLSRSACDELGLVKRVSATRAQVQPPSGKPLVGCMEGPPAHIHLQSDATPYRCVTARRVPHHLFGKVREELGRMEDGGIITKVKEPTEWCSPMVPVLKPNGKVRICVDLKRLNASVKREAFQLPTIEDTLATLSNSTVFTTLDTANGFWQIPLSSDSAKLTTFITPFGRYHFNRLPFGITSAPEIFQARVSGLLDGLPGVSVYMDDIIVYGRTMEEHDRHLAEVMRVLDAAHITLNKEKCRFRQSQVKFLGHLITNKGVLPNPAKISAITSLKPPKDVSDLRRLLGMFNFLARFIPNLSEVSSPLRTLLRDDTVWNWAEPQQEAFNRLKQLATEAPCLAFYDPSRPTVVSADASSYGLGAVLLQQHGTDYRAVAYASRSLTDTEREYAQIEKECLAVVWACERFHSFVYGCPSLVVHTDHKPLIPLINTRDLNRVPLRCQRLLMRLMAYNPTAVHIPGKNLVVADALSRSPEPCTETPSLDAEITINVAASIQSIVSSGKSREIASATAADPVLNRVLQYIRTGWPSSAKGLEQDIQSYYHERQLLSCVDGVVYHGPRIVIPPSMRSAVLASLHDGHLGVSKCKARAKDSIWWSGLSKQIENMVATCPTCTKHRTQHREPLKPVPRPALPWSTIGCDLMEHRGKSYLVVVDYLSRYLDVIPMTSTTSARVIAHLHSLFAVHGIPDTVVSDNGPQFGSAEFRSFATSYGFTHRTSSPQYPQSNGEAERAVRTAKGLLEKNTSLADALLAYRATPLANGFAPAQLLFGRRLRTTLPVTAEQLKPEWPDLTAVAEKEATQQDRQKADFDRRHATLPLPVLQPGDKVWLADTGAEGTVLEQLSDRSYRVRIGSSGATLRRNRHHLIQQPSAPPVDTDGPVCNAQPNAAEPDRPIRHNRGQPARRLIEEC